MESLPCSAGAIARQRLEQYLNDILTDAWDESVWEFYTFLFEQAKKHQLDVTGYASLAYLSDKEQALKNYKLTHSGT